MKRLSRTQTAAMLRPTRMAMVVPAARAWVKAEQALHQSVPSLHNLLNSWEENIAEHSKYALRYRLISAKQQARIRAFEVRYSLNVAQKKGAIKRKLNREVDHGLYLKQLLNFELSYIEGCQVRAQELSEQIQGIVAKEKEAKAAYTTAGREFDRVCERPSAYLVNGKTRMGVPVKAWEVELE